MKEGPKFGYIAETDKSYQVVAPMFVDEAKMMFSKFLVNAVSGQKLLGVFVGRKKEAENWISCKVSEWEKSLNILSDVGKKQPQATFVAVS